MGKWSCQKEEKDSGGDGKDYVGALESTSEALGGGDRYGRAHFQPISMIGGSRDYSF